MECACFSFQGKRLSDGGLVANNPSGVAFHEAKKLWPNREVDFILNLGTGKVPERVSLLDRFIVRAFCWPFLLIRSTEDEKWCSQHVGHDGICGCRNRHSYQFAESKLHHHHSIHRLNPFPETITTVV